MKFEFHLDSESSAPRRCGGTGVLPALLDLSDRFVEQFGHPGANLLLGNAFWLQILGHLAQDIVVAGFLEVGEHNLLCIGFGVTAAFAQDSRRPQAKHLVPAGHSLEFELLVMRELLFEAFFALVECRGHAALASHRVYMQLSSALHIAAPPSRQHERAFYGEIRKWKT